MSHILLFIYLILLCFIYFSFQLLLKQRNVGRPKVPRDSWHTRHLPKYFFNSTVLAGPTARYVEFGLGSVCQWAVKEFELFEPLLTVLQRSPSPFSAFSRRKEPCKRYAAELCSRYPSVCQMLPDHTGFCHHNGSMLLPKLEREKISQLATFSTLIWFNRVW